MEKQSIAKDILESIKTFLLAFLVFGPITGLILDGYSYTTDLMRPVLLALGTTVFVFFVRQWGHKVSARKQSDAVLVGGSPLQKFLKGRNRKILFFSGFTALLLILPFLVDNYVLRLMISALIYVLLGLGLNIVVGFAGLLDLGFVAFYAVGAYGYALGFEYLGIGFLGAIPLAAITAGMFGCILGFPVLRMHGDYLAIVTLGFGEIIRLVITNWIDFTGGPNGIAAPAISFFGVEFKRRAEEGGVAFHELLGIEYDSSYRNIAMYLLLLALVAFISFAVYRIKNMSIGRAWEALREDEIACRSLGINHVTVKLSAFSMGASIGGMAGVFFAASQGFIDPTSFTFFESALILAIVVLGGLGSIPGVIIAAVVLTVLPEILRDIAEYRVLMFGILMVVMMILKPRGLLSIRRPDYSKYWQKSAASKQGNQS